MTQPYTEDVWDGCYSEGWQGIVVPDAFSHPAKYSRSLIRHIYEHLIADGLLSPGDSVVDPFGGVGLGGLDACELGLHWTGIELESRFVELGNHNIAFWNERFGSWMPGRWGSAVLLQGDSRKLTEVLGEADGCVSSPPYGNPAKGLDAQEMDKKQAIINGLRQERKEINGGKGISGRLGASILAPEGYGDTPGNLGNLPASEKGFDAAVTSPPYASMSVEKNSSGVDRAKQYESYRASGGAASFEAFCMTQDKHSQGYGSSNGQLSSLPEGNFDAAISSPPYSDSMEAKGGIDASKSEWAGGPHSQARNSDTRYGISEGQLGGMKDKGMDGCVSSPPYEASIHDPCARTIEHKAELLKAGGHDAKKWLGNQRCRQIRDGDYGDTEGQVGSKDGEDFWSAARIIVEQVHAVLKPGGVACWVCKDFVRDKKRVPFSRQWATLCEVVGFEIIHWHKASLVQEFGSQLTLDGGQDDLKKSRMSFFRRLHVKKYPHLAIEWEDVICMVKR